MSDFVKKIYCCFSTLGAVSKLQSGVVVQIFKCSFQIVHKHTQKQIRSVLESEWDIKN
jgi:hypothetical protein